MSPLRPGSAHPWGVTLALCIGLATIMIVHLGTGSQPLSVDEIIAALAGEPHEPYHEIIVTELRLPRALIGVVAGALLGVAGAILQCCLGNALATPELTGVTAGAVFAVVLVGDWALRTSGLLLPAAAFAGGLGASAIVLLLAGSRRRPLDVALLGVLVGGVFFAGTMLLLVQGATSLGGSLRWLVGSLNGVTWDDWNILWPAAVISGLAVIACVPLCNLLSLGDDATANAGIRPARARLVVFFVAAFVTASAVSIVGSVGFVGLVAPHLGRRFVGADHRALIPVSALLGAALVETADVAAQWITRIPLTAAANQRAGLPAGAATALIGGIFLLALVRTQSSRWRK